MEIPEISVERSRRALDTRVMEGQQVNCLNLRLFALRYCDHFIFYHGHFLLLSSSYNHLISYKILKILKEIYNLLNQLANVFLFL